MGSAEPYASIIIPTHDRAETLAISVESALSQTEERVEVMIVGDGCSPKCRSVAEQCRRNDPRVRFLDRDKAPFNGVAHRDAAIREARAERIFYNDDDDILLPHHVATLGPMLDTLDMADTPVASVAPNGRVDLGLHDSGHALQRGLLARGTFKAVFDTHLAHRRSAYLRL